MANYFEKLRAGLDVDESLDNITAPAIGGTTSKLEALAARKNEKLQNLAGGQALDTLTGDAFYQELDRVAQQPTNNRSPEEMQYAMGYTAGDQILTDDNGRYKFKTDPVTGQYARDDQGEWVKDYEVGRGRNIYIDSNVEGDKKLGLAAEDKGFLGRYTPDWKQYIPGLKGYGWEPGPKGVTTADGAEMDITTDYDAATDLEKVVHSNVGQIKNRSIGQGPVDALDEYYYGSGKTEYTKDAAPMWNIGYKDDGKALEAGTPLPGESRGAIGFEEPGEGTDTKLTKTLKAFGTSLTKELVVDTVDWVLEATNLGDLGNEEEKAKMVNSWVKYNPKDLQEATKKVSLLTSEAIAQAKKGNYKVAAGLIAEGAATAAMEPELGASSFGVIGAWAAPGTWLTKGSKLAKTAKAAEAITAGGKVKGVAIASKEGLKTLAKQQSGYTAAAIGNVNDQYEEWVANNDGVELDGMEKIEFFATRLPLQMFNQNLDAITAVGVIKSPSMLKDLGRAVVGITEKEFGKVAVNIGKSIAGVATAMPKEAAQEYSQRMMELFNERYGSEKFKNLDTFFKFMVDEGNIEEAAVDAVMGAGGAVQFKAVGAIVPAASKVLEGKTKSVDELTKEAEAATTSNVESKFDTYTSDVEVNADLGVPSSQDVVKEAKDAKEAVDVMTGVKTKILNENFEIEDGKIVGLKEGADRKALGDWVEDYTAFSADEKGNLPDAVQKEVDILRTALLDTTTATEVAQKQMQGVELTGVETAYAAKYTEKVDAKKKELEVETTTDTVSAAAVQGIDEAIEGKSTEDTIKEVERRTDVLARSLGLSDEKVIEEVKAGARKKILNTLGISGFGEGVNFEIDEDILEATLQEEIGLKTKTQTKRSNQGEKAVPVGLITNEDIDEIMKGEGVNGAKIASDADNTKLRARVLRKLDPTTTKNVTDTLIEVGGKLAKGVEKNVEKAKKYLQGDVEGNLQRLMLVGMSTINAATESDTDGRRLTESDSSMLVDDQYYAGMSGTMEQIGKDYAMSYGLKLKGSPESLAKAHRDLGRLAIEALVDADLVEVSSDNIHSRAGDVQTTENKKLVGASTKKGVRTYKGKDKKTGKDVLLVQDRGVRLKDATPMYDENDMTGTRIKYESKSGDAVKRVVKLILPNAERVPSTKKNTGDVKVAQGIEVSEETRQKVKDAGNKPLSLKKGVVRSVLDHLKYMNESTDGGIAAQRNNTIVSAFLGLKETGSEILEAGESGSNMSKLDNLIGILDNVDTLEQNVYYTFQVDINNRMTIRETAANYQGDKVFARNVMTAGEYKVSTEPEKEIFVDYLYKELGLDGDKETAINEIAEYYEEILANSDGAADIIDYVVGGMAKGQPLAGAAKKGGIAVLSMLEATKNFKDAKGGDITTEFMVEKDASASGVFNTLINLSGMDPVKFKKTLMELGVRFNGKGIDPKDEVDAYNILGRLIRGELDGAISGETQRASEMNLAAVQKMVDVIKDDEILRELAKYPIMTWFYAAEKDSIVENMSTEMTKVLLDKALDGNENTIEYLGAIMGITEPTVDKIRAVKPLSKEHKALRKELADIGAVYYGNLEKAFPDVAKRKKEMNEYYKYLDDNGKVDGKDYWEGKVRTAVGAMDGSNSRMSLYQWKNVAMDLSAAEKVEKGITTDDESLTLVTMMARMPNQTSMMALMAHSIDATQAINGLASVPSNYGIMAVHDGFYGRPQDLINFQTKAEEVTKNVAIEYDMAEEMARAMDETAKGMRAEEVQTAGLKRKAGLLEAKAESIRETNNPTRKAKEALLKDAATTLFGKEGYAGTETKTETKVEEGLDVKTATFETVKSMLKELSWVEDGLYGNQDIGRVEMSTKETVKKLIVKAKTRESKKKLQELAANRRSFSYQGVAYIGDADVPGLKGLADGTVEIDLETLDTTKLADVVLHEVEHAVSDGFIDRELEEGGKIYKEYTVLSRLLEKAINESRRTRNPRAQYILGMAKNGDFKQAVKEIVAVSKEADGDKVIAELGRVAGVQEKGFKGLIDKIIEKIKEYFETKTVDELVNEADTHTIAAAVKNIQEKARAAKGPIQAEDATISELKAEINLC